MKNTLIFIFKLLVALVSGAIVNMALVSLFPMLIPPPAGADTSSMAGLSETMHLFQPVHFIGPFLAHSLGTFVGALVAIRLLPARAKLAATVVGVWFLVGGISAVFMLPAPLWFEVVDLLFAYLPMAWLAYKLFAPAVNKAE